MAARPRVTAVAEAREQRNGAAAARAGTLPSLQRHEQGVTGLIRITPFHPRTSALNETGLWEHWSNHLAAVRYQASEKFEYFAIRNSAGLFDSSPLYKYRVAGPDAERYLAGVLTRDVRGLPPGRAQYTLWCDDRGFVLEDGILLRLAPNEFLLTAAEPNLAYFDGLRGRERVGIEDVTDAFAILAVQGPRSRTILASLAPEVADLSPFGVIRPPIAGTQVILSRTGFTGDLGYELWIPSDAALAVWDAIWDSGRGHAVIPFGLTALSMARIEAGLLLLDVDFQSSRYAWSDDQRSTPSELGLGWMVRDVPTTDRAFIGRDAIRRELAGGTSRWRLTGLVVDWRDWDRRFDAAGLIPPKDHMPIHDEYYLYDDHGRQLGWASSLMYSPMLQRQIALARVPLDLAKPGSRVKLEYPVIHLKGSDWDAERQRLGDTVQRTLESFFPGFSDLVLHREVVTPLDIERVVGLSEGNIFAGEFLAPQMFFFRPAPGWAQYRTPIEGYYQCGSGTHPGGCVMGAPGKLAAERILRDRAAIATT